MISRVNIITALSVVVLLGIYVAVLSATNVLEIVPGAGLRPSCNHVGPGTLIVVAVLGLVMVTLTVLSVRFWLSGPSFDYLKAKGRPH